MTVASRELNEVGLPGTPRRAFLFVAFGKNLWGVPLAKSTRRQTNSDVDKNSSGKDWEKD